MFDTMVNYQACKVKQDCLRLHNIFKGMQTIHNAMLHSKIYHRLS